MCVIIMFICNIKIKCFYINFYEKVNLKSYFFFILKKNVICICSNERRYVFDI